MSAHKDKPRAGREVALSILQFTKLLSLSQALSERTAFQPFFSAWSCSGSPRSGVFFRTRTSSGSKPCIAVRSSSLFMHQGTGGTRKRKRSRRWSINGARTSTGTPVHPASSFRRRWARTRRSARRNPRGEVDARPSQVVAARASDRASANPARNSVLASADNRVFQPRGPSIAATAFVCRHAKEEACHGEERIRRKSQPY